jgi:inorganic pyrophosphatase
MALSQVPVAPAAVIRCRSIGALLMEDENGIDEKIINVPVDALNPFYDDIGELTDLPSIFRDQIEHFFLHYKDLERGKWVKVTGWADREKPARSSCRRFRASYHPERGTGLAWRRRLRHRCVPELARSHGILY